MAAYIHDDRQDILGELVACHAPTLDLLPTFAFRLPSYYRRVMAFVMRTTEIQLPRSAITVKLAVGGI